MTNAVPSCHFDRGKVFAPLVVQYVASLIGMKELAGHGAVARIRAEATAEGITFEAALARIHDDNKLPPDVTAHRERFEVLPPLNLDSAVCDRVPVDVEMLARELFENGGYYLASVLPATAGALLITAYERCKAMHYTTTDPLWEFLRHCRHAAAHGNRFNFLGKEPVRKASWKSLTIESSLQGTTLFQDSLNGPHLLRPADPIHLLWDIEQQYPALKV